MPILLHSLLMEEEDTNQDIVFLKKREKTVIRSLSLKSHINI
jgi:hypothetical protein